MNQRNEKCLVVLKYWFNKYCHDEVICKMIDELSLINASYLVCSDNKPVDTFDKSIVEVETFEKMEEQSTDL